MQNEEEIKEDSYELSEQSFDEADLEEHSPGIIPESNIGRADISQPPEDKKATPAYFQHRKDNEEWSY